MSSPHVLSGLWTLSDVIRTLYVRLLIAAEYFIPNLERSPIHNVSYMVATFVFVFVVLQPRSHTHDGVRFLHIKKTLKQLIVEND